MPDEAVYASLGQSLYRSFELTIFGGGTALFSFVYPLLNGLPLAYGDLERGYTILKAIQAVVMSLAAVPVYLWGRRLMAPGWALVAAALTLAIPGLLYSGLIMTEVAFLPVSLLAAWAMARALEEPTLRRQAILVAAVGLACATRLQAIALAPALLTGLGLAAWFGRDRGLVRRFLPTLAGLSLVALAWGVFRLHEGGPWTKLLGSYEAATSAPWDPLKVTRFVLYHVADVLMLVAAVPLCALVLLALDAAAGREARREVRAFLAVAVSIVVWFVLEVGAFASVHVDRLAERDLLALTPLLFLAFALWLDRGAPRPRLATGLVALVALALLAALPIKRFSQAEALPDAFSIAPFFELIERNRDFDPSFLLLFVGSALLLGFALLPRRLVVLLPVAVLAVLLTQSVAASSEVSERATYDDEFLLGDRRDWITKAVGDEEVALLYTGELYWNGVYQQRFWNSNISHVYYLYPTAVPGPIPQEPLTVGPDGMLVRSAGRFVPERYVAAPETTKFIGEPVAELPQYGIMQPGLVLWRLNGDMKLSFTVTGVRPDGDMHEPARMIAHECRGGYFRITLIAKASRRVDLLLNGKPYRTLRFKSDGDTFTEDIPAVPEPQFRTCTLEIRGDSLLGSTVLEFLRP
jgi:Dolichyl-phosphate-mannose-protein mannosyltransferase